MSRLAALLLVGLGCASASPDGGVATDMVADATSDSDTADASASTCGEAPTLRWANFAQGFFVQSCQSCHASTSFDRRGAPADVTFDTLDDTLRWAERIRARTVEALAGEAPGSGSLPMPPAGGVSAADRALLEAWLDCGEPGATRVDRPR